MHTEMVSGYSDVWEKLSVLGIQAEFQDWKIFNVFTK